MRDTATDGGFSDERAGGGSGGGGDEGFGAHQDAHDADDEEPPACQPRCDCV